MGGLWGALGTVVWEWQGECGMERWRCGDPRADTDPKRTQSPSPQCPQPCPRPRSVPTMLTAPKETRQPAG